jgi:hypothetical protein
MLETDQEARTGFESNECAGCGLKREWWSASAGKGYVKEGLTYCCQGCAKNAKCRCDSISAGIRSAPKNASRIIEELRHKPGIQVVEHGRIYAERRSHQAKWTRRTERRSPASRGGSPLS